MRRGALFLYERGIFRVCRSLLGCVFVGAGITVHFLAFKTYAFRFILARSNYMYKILGNIIILCIYTFTLYFYFNHQIRYADGCML